MPFWVADKSALIKISWQRYDTKHAIGVTPDSGLAIDMGEDGAAKREPCAFPLLSACASRSLIPDPLDNARPEMS
jgi:hypothetical protein